MARRIAHQLAYRAIRIEGGLIPADELTRLTLLADPKATEQTEGHYRIAKGLKLRDEIARDFKIALHLWHDFQALRRRRQDVQAHEVTVREWLLPLLRDVLHFHDVDALPGHRARRPPLRHWPCGQRRPGARWCWPASTSRWTAPPSASARSTPTPAGRAAAAPSCWRRKR